MARRRRTTYYSDDIDLSWLPWQVRLILIILIFGFALWTVRDLPPYRDWFHTLSVWWDIAVSTAIFIGKIVAAIFAIAGVVYVAYLAYSWREEKKAEEERRRRMEEMIRLEEERRRREEEERRRFEEEMKAKGYVKYQTIDGEWVWGPPEEAKKYNYFAQVVQAIEEFWPPKRYENEEGYHHTLFAWLKSRFPKTKMEYQVGASRPDIVVEVDENTAIAIEVKGPTGSQDLQTIADKAMRYMHHFKHLIVVLFDVRVNPVRYQEWYEGLKRTFPDVVVIRRDFRKV